MTNRAYSADADTPEQHEDAIVLAGVVVDIMTKGAFKYVPMEEAYKAYDVVFSDGTNEIRIECECRDIEEDGNWDRLWNGQYPTIHAPTRKYNQPDARWTDYLAYSHHKPWQIALFKRHHLDTKSKATRARGEDFRDLSRSLVYFAEIDIHTRTIEPHVLRSLQEYTLG